MNGYPIAEPSYMFPEHQSYSYVSPLLGPKPTSPMQMGRAQQLFSHVPLQSTLYHQQPAPSSVHSAMRASSMSRPIRASVFGAAGLSVSEKTIGPGKQNFYNVFGGGPGELEEDVGLCLKMSEVFEEIVGWME